MKNEKTILFHKSQSKISFDCTVKFLKDLGFKHTGYSISFDKFPKFCVYTENKTFITQSGNGIFRKTEEYPHGSDFRNAVRSKIISKNVRFNVYNTSHLVLIYNELRKRGWDFVNADSYINATRNLLEHKTLLLMADYELRKLRWGTSNNTGWANKSKLITYEQMMEGEMDELPEIKKEFTLSLNDSYKAIVDESGVHVGCQTFSHKRVIALAELVVDNFKQEK